MTSNRPLILGTRGSELALWQARRVSALINEHLDRECRIKIIKTQGDKIQNVAFHKMEGKGFFTKELQRALLDGSVDLVVHSLKDLPTEEPEGLTVVAIPERHDAADLLLAIGGSLSADHRDPFGLKHGAVLGTSSLRRAAQALAMRPDLELRALRGNVPTRVTKLREGQYDAILLAAAGVRRLELDLDGLDALELTPEAMLPAPGQGALGIEVRSGDLETEPLAVLHDAVVARCVTAERGLLSMLGGGCHLPLGCLASDEDGAIRLMAVLGEIDEDITTATVTRVGAVAPTPEQAALGCFNALQATTDQKLGA